MAAEHMATLKTNCNLGKLEIEVTKKKKNLNKNNGSAEKKKKNNDKGREGNMKD